MLDATVRGVLAPRVRLALLVAFVVAGFSAFWVFDLVEKDDVRGWVDAFGPLAPVAYVPISTALGLLLVPGPVLAGVSGLLFGTAVGTVVTLSGAILTGVCGLLIGRHAGRDGAVELGGERHAALEALLSRRGFEAVVVQRLVPGVPDAPLNYAFGAVGLSVANMALGTLIGSAPRAFSYTAIGASLDDPGSLGAIAGVVVLVLVTVVGAELGRRAWSARRS